MMETNEQSRSDKEMVKLLWDGDPAAWEMVFVNAVLPVLRQRSIAAILYDRALSREEVFDIVFDEMISRKKLANYSGRGSLFGWMKFYVRGVIYGYCRKNTRPVSVDPIFPPLDNKSAPETFSEKWEVVQKCFSDLWHENPMRAYVHLLKVKYEMSAADIKNMLNISSEDNVNQLFSRAVKDMRKLREKYEE